nr:primase-helicase family protein [Plastoroseomonas arctica]
MKGGEGTGKGTLAKALMRLVGYHGLAVYNSKHLVGNFNAHLRDTILLFADEAFFAGDRAAVGVLKGLITEPWLMLEGKFQNAVQGPNYLHILMASNEDWVVPASLDARRFFVLEVSEARKNDIGYFAAIWQQMDAGGFEAMLHDLLHMDLTTFNVRAVPATEGLERQRKLSLTTTEAWWQDCLERGYVFRSCLGLEAVFAVWHPTVTTHLLFASYLAFAKSRGERRILTREDLGRFFASMRAEAFRWRNGIVSEHLADVETSNGVTRMAKVVKLERAYGYKLGDLTKARNAFTQSIGLDVEWESGTDPADDGADGSD